MEFATVLVPLNILQRVNVSVMKDFMETDVNSVTKDMSALCLSIMKQFAISV